MNASKRTLGLVGLMLALMVVATGWSTLRMLHQRQAARAASDDLERSRELADQISALRARGAFALSQGDSASQQQLAEDIQAAALKAGITGHWQQGIEHQRASRVGKTPYLRKPAVLITRGLTLSQLTQLLHHLTYDSAYTAEAIRLHTPSGEDPGDRWDAEVTISHLIYAPEDAGGLSGSEG